MVTGITRAAWGPLLTSAQRQGWTFARAFTTGRAMGLSTYRRAVMLGDWRVARGIRVSRSMIESLSRTEIVPTAWLGEAPEGQRGVYRYIVEMRGRNLQTGEPVYRALAIESETPFTRGQIEETAWEKWGGTYEGAEDFYEGVTLFSGSVK